MSSGGPSFPTLRCPNCGNSDLHFKAGGQVRCGRCMKVWTRDQLTRTRGTAGSSYDDDAKGRGED